jgi:histone H3/H4
MASFPVVSVRTPDNPEDILGQFYCAFGQGAGSMRISRSAIAALRERYRAPIEAAPGPWKSRSANVLGFVAQVGRTAALLATEAGRTAINADDFSVARRRVEGRVHAGAEMAGMLIAGPYCPPVAGDVESDPVGADPLAARHERSERDDSQVPSAIAEAFDREVLSPRLPH